jgi:putative SOS response-associated peptidase YedK
MLCPSDLLCFTMAKMCGRFTNAVPFEVLSGRLNAELVEVSYYDKPRYNIAPSQPVACIRMGSDQAWQVELIRWGLVPSWADDVKIGYKMINARAETVGEKPSFRSAFKNRRCLIVADGWYEWQASGGVKRPYHLHFADRRPFCFAGLWERWNKQEGDPLETCTIITTSACDDTASVHDRMPAIVPPDEYLAWLDPDFQDREHLESLLQPWAVGGLQATEVSRRVNVPKNEGPECIESLV